MDKERSMTDKTIREDLDGDDRVRAAIAAVDPPSCESNTFATHPSGFSVHFKLVADFGQLIPMTEGLAQHLVEAGYTPGTPLRAGGSGGGAPARKAGPSGPPCDFCDTPSYENTAKASGKKYLKCSNKQCNAVAFADRNTGEWGWKEDTPRDA
jgi:hypothetical protein